MLFALQKKEKHIYIFVETFLWITFIFPLFLFVARTIKTLKMPFSPASRFDVGRNEENLRLP